MAKKLLDLSGLQRYDTNLKDFIDNEVDSVTLTSITTSEVTDLFNNTEVEEPSGE